MTLRPETEKALAASGVTPTDFIDALRVVFPHGHEDFLPTLIAQMELHSVKNHDYAKGGSSLGNFERVAAILSNYPNLKLSDPRVVALVYAMKQVDAVLWGLNSNIEHKVEGANQRLDDISVYASIVQCMNKQMAREKAIDKQFGVDLLKKEVEQLKKDAGVEIGGGPKDARVEVSALGVHPVGGCGTCAPGQSPDDRYMDRGIPRVAYENYNRGRRDSSPYDLSTGDKGVGSLKKTDKWLP
jgi:hypothetical protein